MQRQKLVFFLIVGSAVLLVGLASVWQKQHNSQLEMPAEAVLTPTSEALGAGVMSGKETWNGLKIEVTRVEEDGWPLIKAHNQYNEPPLPGKRMLLITVLVQKVTEKVEGPISIDSSDFKVVGEQGTIYNTYSDETRCGVVPESLSGVAALNYSVSGAICVQVPAEEGEFILIYDSGLSAEPAVYIPLPN